jgi:hypothetical protein
VPAYSPRIVDAELRELLASAGAVVIEDQPAWAPHLRSRARLRKAPKRHFVDPSLALAATGASAERLFEDVEWFGQLFESLVIRDLRVLSQPLDGEVLHYRDDYGVEVDAIVQLHDGRSARINSADDVGKGAMRRCRSAWSGGWRCCAIGNTRAMGRPVLARMSRTLSSFMAPSGLCCKSA